MNPLPEIFAARAKSKMPSCLADVPMRLSAETQTSALRPTRRTSGLSAESFPTTTLSCGRFGIIEQDLLQLRVEARHFGVERGDPFADLFHRRHLRARILPFRLQRADFLADLVALGLEVVAFRHQLAPLFVQRGDFAQCALRRRARASPDVGARNPVFRE